MPLNLLLTPFLFFMNEKCSYAQSSNRGLYKNHLFGKLKVGGVGSLMTFHLILCWHDKFANIKDPGSEDKIMSFCTIHGAGHVQSMISLIWFYALGRMGFDLLWQKNILLFCCISYEFNRPNFLTLTQPELCQPPKGWCKSKDTDFWCSLLATNFHLIKSCSILFKIPTNSNCYLMTIPCKFVHNSTPFFK